MSFDTIRVHKETADKIRQVAEEKGQKIAHCVAEAFGVEIDVLEDNRFVWMNIGDCAKARHDSEDIAELNRLRNKLGRDFTVHPNPDYDFFQDDPFMDREPFIIKRVK